MPVTKLFICIAFSSTVNLGNCYSFGIGVLGRQFFPGWCKSFAMATPRSIEFDEMVSRFDMSIEVLISKLEESVIWFRKFRVENEFLKDEKLLFRRRLGLNKALLLPSSVFLVFLVTNEVIWELDEKEQIFGNWNLELNNFVLLRLKPVKLKKFYLF